MGLTNGSPWLSSVVGELESLARRCDSELFSKESAYAASRMQMRLSGTHESENELLEVPAFLRP